MKKVICLLCSLLLLGSVLPVSADEVTGAAEAATEAVISEAAGTVTEDSLPTEAVTETATEAAGAATGVIGETGLTTSQPDTVTSLVSKKVVEMLEDTVRVSRADMVGDCGSFYLRLKENNKVLLPLSLDTVSISASAGDERQEIKFSENRGEDGVISITPYYVSNSTLANMFMSWITSYRLQEGTVPVTITVTQYPNDIQTYHTTLIINHESTKRQVFNLLTPWILVLILLGFLFKFRFHSRCKIYYIEGKMVDGAFKSTGYLSRTRPGKRAGTSFKPTLWTFIPFLANRIALHGIVFRAKGFSFGHNRRILVKTSTLGGKGVLLDTVGLDPHKITKITPDRFSPVSEGERYQELDKTHGVLCPYGKYMFAYIISFRG